MGLAPTCLGPLGCRYPPRACWREDAMSLWDSMREERQEGQRPAPMSRAPGTRLIQPRWVRRTAPAPLV